MLPSGTQKMLEVPKNSVESYYTHCQLWLI